MTSAYIAYQNLSPAAKRHIAEILRKHPAYPDWIREMPAGTDRNVEAFLQAAIWPDKIKSDDRFWDPTSSSHNQPTVMLPGYSDMQRHNAWHYRDTPLAAPGVKFDPPEEPNLVEAATAMLTHLDDPYQLAWFIHLTADAHQPLHAVSRFTAEGGKDNGGNKFTLDPPFNSLHGFWDGVGGRDMDRAAVAANAKDYTTRNPAAAAALNTSIESWMDESVETARTFVYTATQPKLTPEYQARAAEIAKKAIALSGYRLAAVLNDRLQ